METFILKTPPATEPLTLAEAKAHLRVDIPDEDTLISGLIVAARQMAEQHTGRPLISQTWTLYTSSFTAPIEFKPGAQSITSVKYQDSDNAQQTLADTVYELRRGLVPELGLKYSQSWPSVLCHPDSVQIEFVAGYGASGDDVPQQIKQAMLLVLGQLYEYREEIVVGTIVSQIPKASEYLLQPYRIPFVG